jgi:hypothetical protein
VKIIISKEEKNWYEIEKIKAKHAKIIIPDSRWFKENKTLNDPHIFWCDEIYSEFSSFGFIWNNIKKIKINEKKEVTHSLLMIINA